MAPAAPVAAADTQMKPARHGARRRVRHGMRAELRAQALSRPDRQRRAPAPVAAGRDGATCSTIPAPPGALSAAGRISSVASLEHLPGLLAVTARRQLLSAAGARLVVWRVPPAGASTTARRRCASRRRTGGTRRARVNIELKAVDSSCNPHLALGAMMAAGSTGSNGASSRASRWPSTRAAWASGPAYRGCRWRWVRRSTLLARDAVLTGAMGASMRGTYTALKRSEVAAFAGAGPRGDRGRLSVHVLMLDLTPAPVVDNHCHGVSQIRHRSGADAYRHFTESRDPVRPRPGDGRALPVGDPAAGGGARVRSTEEAVLAARAGALAGSSSTKRFLRADARLAAGRRRLPGPGQLRGPRDAGAARRLPGRVDRADRDGGRAAGGRQAGAWRSSTTRCARTSPQPATAASAGKTVAAYRSGLAVRVRDRADVHDAYKRLRRMPRPRVAEQPLVDHIVALIMEAAAEQDLPVQCDTGYGDSGADLVLGNPLPPGAADAPVGPSVDRGDAARGHTHTHAGRPCLRRRSERRTSTCPMRSRS